MFQVVRKDGIVLCRGIEREYARGFARTWNRLIDQGEPGAYIQTLRVIIRKPQG